MKKAYLFDSCSALAVFLFSFVFGTFNVGYYASGSFWGFAIGSMIAGLLRIACNPKATFASSLSGLAVIVPCFQSVHKKKDSVHGERSLKGSLFALNS